jgi:hypothetical protein
MMAKSKKPGGSKRDGAGVGDGKPPKGTSFKNRVSGKSAGRPKDETAGRKVLKNNDYQVGHAKPPKHTQFKKVASGNKAGRPKGSKNLSTLIMEAAHGQVTATIDGTSHRISRAQATTLKLAARAAAGDPQALAMLLHWIDEIERRPQ